MYFVPGGRIGFQRPAAIAHWTSSWHLLSSDQTFQVEVREALRIDADWDDRMWQPARHVLVASSFASPGIEHRHFRDQRFDERDADYGASTHVFRDEHWIGQIRISTSTLGSRLLSVPGGQVARWRDVIDALISSLAVRPSLSAADALAELLIYLTLEGLNPRLVGDQLILSLAPPATPLEASGAQGSYILLSKLSLLPLGSPERREQATNAAFAVYQGTPGSRVIAGSHCRAVVLRENRRDDGDEVTFSTKIMAFGQTRQLEISSHYGVRDRDRILQALERVVLSLSLPDSL